MNRNRGVKARSCLGPHSLHHPSPLALLRSGYLLQLTSQTLEVKGPGLLRQGVERLADFLDVSSPIFVSLKITVAINISTGRIPCRQIPEKDVDGDAELLDRCGAMKPERRDIEHLSGLQDGLLWLGLFEAGTFRRSIGIEDVDRRARCAWGQVEKRYV